MFADVKFFWKTQRATAFLFAVALCVLIASALRVMAQFGRGHAVSASILSVVVLVCALIAWMLGAASLAVARQCRQDGTTD